MKDVYPTKHVLEKLATRDVTWGQIVEVVENPEVIYGPDHRGKKILQRGKLSVVVAADGAVVTVLLRSEEQWDDGDARSRASSDNYVNVETATDSELADLRNKLNTGEV